MLLLALAHGTRAMDGTVETRDGRRFTGGVGLGSNKVVIANLDRTALFEVPLTNLLHLRLPSIPPEEALSWDALEENQGPRKDEGAWQTIYIGPNKRLGMCEVSHGVYKMVSAGQEVGGNRDSFHFMCRRIKGDGELAVRILRWTPATTAAQAGIMIRETRAPEAKNVFLGLTPRGGFFQWRLETSGPTRRDSPKAVLSWLRLKREGKRVTGYTSGDGKEWRPVQSLFLDLEEEIEFGVALTGFRPPGMMRSGPIYSRCLFDQVRAGTRLRFHPFVPRLELDGGSSVAGEIARLNRSEFVRGGWMGPASIRRQSVSRIDFRWIPERLTPLVRAGRPGVLLTSGEFIEGELKRLEKGRAVLSSVLFGLKPFDLNDEVVSIVLDKPRPRLGLFEIKTRSGTIWRGDIQSLTQTGLVVVDAALGPLEVPIYDLKEIIRKPLR
jgi:hypothetical protein